jgi:hypothetical protein
MPLLNTGSVVLEWKVPQYLRFEVFLFVSLRPMNRVLLQDKIHIDMNIEVMYAAVL